MNAEPRSDLADEPCEICGPPIELDGVTTLRVAHLSAVDKSAIEKLYATLSPHDLHRRFFSGTRPPPRFFERWAAIGERGGLDLGAVVETDLGASLAGEAGYALLADGDGELGIAVDPKFRGWLGPWLLDVLLAHAAERGVPNMQALVLTDNRAMMSLAASRGSAVLDHPDWGLVRLTMSTAGHTPSWPRPHPKPRVLVESERSRWAAENELRDAGFDIAICGGACRRAGYCPILDGEPCPLIEGADAVVVDLPERDVRFVEFVAAERTLHPAVRLIAGFSENPDGTSRRRPAAELLQDLDDLRPNSQDDRRGID